jgi:hypothetical protein
MELRSYLLETSWKTMLASARSGTHVVVALEGLGHDPLRAVGALLLELPALSNRVLARRSTCSFRLPPPLRMHARISSRSLNGEDTSRTSSARRCSSTRTNSRGLASPKQPGAAAR